VPLLGPTIKIGLHPEKAMALEGTLEELNIVAVLQMIASGGMTGSLRVWDATHRASIAFVQGQIIHADSTLQGDRLGEVLVRTRRITPAQLAQATATQAEQPGKRIGQVLVELGLISVEDLAMAVEIQIIEVMSRLLAWTRGRWQFQFTAPDPSGTIPVGAMTVDEILSGQVMLLDDAEPPDDTAARLDEVYTLAAGRTRESVRGALDSDGWQVLGALDGRATLREVAQHIHLDPDKVSRIAGDLLAVNLLTLAAPPREESTSPTNSVPAAPSAPPPAMPLPAASPLPAPAPHASGTVVVRPGDSARINQVLSLLLARAEAKEVCLIDSSGSLIARQGREVHNSYPTLFALAASIFASWQELGRSLGESKASTLLYQGAGLNICLTPVGWQAILMTLYQQNSNSGLVNFWSREASARLGRVLDASAGPAAPHPAAPDLLPPGPRPPAPLNGTDGSDKLSGEFRDEIARQMDDLFHN
jgi:predicted regulator of Ras-like GTPase activity (Roadblock/LC7/MglB family)